MENKRTLQKPRGRQRAKDLADLASRQFGVFSRQQASALGFTNGAIAHRLEAGQWKRVLPGVFRLAGVRDSWQQKLMAAVLWAGDGAVVSHLAAAALHRLEGIAAGAVELTLLTRKTHPDIRLHCAEKLLEGDRDRVGPIPVTSVTRTIVDLSRSVDAETLEAALDDALRRGLTSIPRLRWELQTKLRGQPGSKVLRDLLDERDPKTRPSESILETRFLRLLKKAKLPLPETQYVLKDGRREIARIDFAYLDLRVAIETVGYGPHGARRENWQRGIDRGNELTKRGWLVLQLSWDDVTKRPDEVVKLIKQVLEEQRRLEF